MAAARSTTQFTVQVPDARRLRTPRQLQDERPLATPKRVRTLRESGRLRAYKVGHSVFIDLDEFDALFVREGGGR